MFPLRDHNPSGRTPYVTYALIALNILIFISYWPLFNDPRALNQFFFDWAMIPAFVQQGGDYHTFISSMFLHGGWMHLGGNMLFLWIFGDNLEDKMGHIPYLLFYLACGVGAGFAHYLSAPMSPVPTVGASGAIAGVMGGYLLLFPKARVDVLVILIVFFRILSIPAWGVLAVWFAMQIFGSFNSDPTGGGVAYWAHSGGFVIGAILCLPFFLRLGGPKFWQTTHGHPPHPEATYKLSRTRVPTVKRPTRRGPWNTR
ncbi:Rhomboid protease GluP [Roseovarius albus]|uniref:Rhomboid protease GluP n=1 Tax=Roseovarius albus TaxID=1247867 RepID=A0A1X6YAW3_9RHOB|nr:rhomboid family intramembrane serine protease [Roseovarius albus]SLN15879.1 Rhomboid protease GluP [Roseovarius albus]